MNDNLRRIADQIAQANRSARGRSIERRKHRNPRKPAARWTSISRIGEDEGTAISIVLATRGCSHARGTSGGCTMCSYLLDGTNVDMSNDDLVQQFDDAMESVKDASSPLSVKVYTSGSFLDENEVPEGAFISILEHISEDDRVRQVVLESRPEYVTETKAAQISKILKEKDIEVGIGLESTNDRIRLLCINKGFMETDIKRAIAIARDYGIGMRTYLLVKPPFLSEREALEDGIKSVIEAAEMGATTISINPVNVQKHTLVERMWRSGDYRPPWLWTLVEILKNSKDVLQKSTSIISDPVAGGKRRGTHNCGKCDAKILKAIRQFSLNQDTSVFIDLDCECRLMWAHVLKHEGLSSVVHNEYRMGLLGKS